MQLHKWAPQARGMVLFVVAAQILIVSRAVCSLQLKISGISNWYEHCPLGPGSVGVLGNAHFPKVASGGKEEKNRI